MKLKATLEIEYETGTPAQTVESYGTSDPTLCADIDADGFQKDPWALADQIESASSFKITVVPA